MPKPSTSQLSLYIPHLLNPGPNWDQLKQVQWPECPNLCRLLSRSKAENYLAQNFLERSFNLFNCLPTEPQTQKKDLPFGPLAFHNFELEKEQTQKRWIYRINPVYLHPDMDQLVLLADLSQDLTKEEGQQLCSEINHYFNHSELDQRWFLQYAGPDKIFLISEREIKITTTPISEAIGKPIARRLVVGEDQAYWNQTLNEIQMFLFNMSLNQNRQNQGKTTINSLWMWGGGWYPGQPHINSDSNLLSLDWQKLYIQPPIFSDFSQWLGIDSAAPRQIIEDLQKKVDFGNTLVVFEDLKEAYEQKDFFTWLEKLKTIDQELIPHLLSGLADKKFCQLNLLTDQAKIFHLNSFQLKSWWKRTRDIQNFLVR